MVSAGQAFLMMQNPEAIKEKTKRTPHDYIKIKIKCEGDAS
jgi:hypothetical protein